jgi:murein L,D-transpeptidase YcbB/YkuD
MPNLTMTCHDELDNDKRSNSVSHKQAFMNRMKVLCVLLGASAACCSSIAYAVDDHAISAGIHALVDAYHPSAPHAVAEQHRKDALRTVYALHTYNPLWSQNGVLSGHAIALMQKLQAADVYGLRPSDYEVGLGTDAYANPIPGGTSHRVPTAEFDVALSTTALQFLTDLHFGRVDAHAAGFDLEFARPPLDLPALLERLAMTDSVDQVVMSVEPRFYHYGLLKQALARYRLLAAGTTATPAEGLTAPYPRRIRQIELTLERWRWLPAFTSPPIIVNIPQYRLFAFNSTNDRKSEILQMDVIVGRTYSSLRTPVFAADMKYVIFRPYWDIPVSIMKHEMLPSIRANPDYLRREHLEIVHGSSDSATVLPPTAENIEALASGTLRLRQQPGADNALGLIKFMLPNAHNVYLHSTPAQRLFSQSRRAFSHGCIRVSDPVELAAYVLRNVPGSWTKETIAAAMNASSTRRVNLAKPIPVMILYGTALATEDGPIMFYEDIYGHDRKLEQLLRLPPVREH